VRISRLTAIGVAAALLPYGSALADDITGAGSTFVSPVLSKWSATYSSDERAALAYQSIGSGGGIAALRSETVDFAATATPASGWLSRVIGLVAVALALLSAVATFLVLANLTPITPTHEVVLALLAFNGITIVLLVGVIAREVWRVSEKVSQFAAAVRIEE